MSGNGKPRKISVGRAIAVGLLWVNGPIFPIMFGVPVLTFFVAREVLDRAYQVGDTVVTIVSLVGAPAGFVLAWSWWSITVPKWRLWAYERVDDIAALKERAVAVGLTWPDGSKFERTEIKSLEHAAREQELERQKGGSPSARSAEERDEEPENEGTFGRGAFSVFAWLTMLALLVEVKAVGVSWRMIAPAALVTVSFIAGQQHPALPPLPGALQHLSRATAEQMTRTVAQMLCLAAIALSIWAYWPEVQIIEGRRAAKADRLQEALEFYTAAIGSERLPPRRLGRAYSERGDARYDHSTNFGLDDKELVLALGDYARARQAAPELMDAIDGQGYAYLALGAYREASAAFSEAYKLDQPKPYWSLIHLAEVQRTLKNYDGALKYLDDALKIHGHSPGMALYYHRGLTFFAAGRYREAADAFTLGIPLQPNYAWALTHRACAYAKLGKFDLAIADAKAGLALFEADAKASERTQPWLDHDKRRQGEELVIIQAMAAKTGNDGQADTLCMKYWDPGDDLRSRSPLLAPAS